MPHGNQLVFFIGGKADELSGKNFSQCSFTVVRRDFKDVSIGKPCAIEDEAQIVAASHRNVIPLQWRLVRCLNLSFCHSIPRDLSRGCEQWIGKNGLRVVDDFAGRSNEKL